MLGLFFELALAAADWLRVHLWELKGHALCTVHWTLCTFHYALRTVHLWELEGHAISFKLLRTELFGTALCTIRYCVSYCTVLHSCTIIFVYSPLLNALESSLVQCNWLQLWMGGTMKSAGAALANQPLPFINFRQLVLSSHFHALQLFNYQDSNGRAANN